MQGFRFTKIEEGEEIVVDTTSTEDMGERARNLTWLWIVIVVLVVIMLYVIFSGRKEAFNSFLKTKR